MEFTRDQLLELYYQMHLTRHFEETTERLYRQGRIVGGVFTGRGQEAIPVGTCHPLRKTDFIAPVHRDLGAFLVKGMAPGVLMAQVMGKRDGPSRGKDSWTHCGDMELGIIASTSMLASSIPVACGVALAEQMREKDSVVVSYFGEGTTARGDFHEALNFAGIHDLPVLFVCENNQYAYSTPTEKEMPVVDVADRGPAYGMPGVAIDGNDVRMVVETTCEAIERARLGEGPTLIECKTYRYSGHSAHDQDGYRPPQEVEEWHGRDPIHRFHDDLVMQGVLTDDDDDEIMRRIESDVQEAVEFATKSPYPKGEEATDGVYGSG
ncbi:MAG: thiamine pyrophosphate-dependent dehydrogenase E1 component subunit alpha [Armatimonadota bacterium]